MLSPLNVPTEEGSHCSSIPSPSDATTSSVNGYTHEVPAITGEPVAEDKVSYKLPHESATIVDGQATAVHGDANLKAIWDEEMKDVEPAGKPHRTTAVLMISWVEEASDLNITTEVCELERVFTEVFHFEVIKRQISSGSRDMLPGVQVTKYLVELVERFDSDSTLLIVYYAGHGIPARSGGLHLAG